MTIEEPSSRPLLLESFDSALGRQIVELTIWAMRQGLAGIPADLLLDGRAHRGIVPAAGIQRAGLGRTGRGGGEGRRLRRLGRHSLRGVREAREIYALDLGEKIGRQR
jgi:hypothetical protein